MIEFERTADFDLIRRIITHPEVYRFLVDDFSPEPEDWQPLASDAVWYIVAREESEDLGIFILLPERPIYAKMHVCFLPKAWGDRAGFAAKGIIPWIWQSTEFHRLVGEIPKYNERALRFAVLMGAKEIGVNQESFLKDGKLHDQVLFGLSRPKGMTCLQQQ